MGPRTPSRSPDSPWAGGVRKVLASAAFVLLAHLALAERGPIYYEPMGAPNGCFVESVACFDAFREAVGEEPWARVLQWGAKEDEVMVAGHAVAVFQASGRLWCWDVNFGWKALPLSPDQRDDAAAVAAPVLSHYPRIAAVYPMYWNDFDQSPGSAPEGGDSGAQDIELVAQRLSRHRPVNLVSFSVDGSKTYALVFIFGGRLCFYTAEKGTILFRMRGTVSNVAMVRFMVHRAFPDAGAVQEVPSGSSNP